MVSSVLAVTSLIRRIMKMTLKMLNTTNMSGGMIMTMEMRVKTQQWDSVIMVKTRLGQADLHQDNRGALDSAVGATK